MREEHPNQQDLPNLSPGAGSAQVREMSDVAQVQSKVLEMGLVRENRPVFVYDAKIAKEKSSNAERQERHRKKIADAGLVVMHVPAAIASAVKTASGDWSIFTSVLNSATLGVCIPQTPAPSGLAPQTPFVGGSSNLIPPTVWSEIVDSGGIDQWVQKKIDSVVTAMPKPSILPPQIIQKVVEKIVEKPVLKLNAEQKKIYEIGAKVGALRGWRASLISWLIR